MRAIFKLSVIGFIVLLFAQPVWAAGGEKANGKTLASMVEQGVHEAEEGEISKATALLNRFHERWETVEGKIRQEAPESYKQIETSYAKANALATSTNPDPKQVERALEELGHAVGGYADGASEASNERAPGASMLLGLSGELDEAKEYAGRGQWNKAKEEYGAFHEGWKSVEDSVRSSDIEAYEQIETKMGLVSAALNANPPEADQVKENIDGLGEAIEQYANGKGSEDVQSKEKSVRTLVHVLKETLAAIDAGNAEKAKEEITEFITIWPTIEGQVKTRSAEAYEDTENNMTKALSLLSSTPPKMEKAKDLITGMKTQLQPLTKETNYNFWDAAIILLREGLEIILIIAALLGFLKKSNNADKRPWIWGGAGVGVLASVAIAFLLTSIMSVASAGEEREFLEGITGLIAVVVMFTVGSWLHNKSNTASWNKYIKDKVGTVLARGSLWSLAFVAFLTVVREGAETVIFYLGIAGDISAGQLMLGILTALAILLAIGFAIIKCSVKLPISTLFLCITVLIYYVAFKFTGESLHALQVVEKLPAHPISGFPAIGWLGVYPTWETVIAQILLLVLIAFQTIYSKRTLTKQRETIDKAEKQTKVTV
ncbi:FTR1 family iron permease [Terrilactibacillus laevilacticus]|uniref:FTR1 family protein n=1 Tax=Terrilactibacillus laevilacticus TaxID=1380157 RepID=A0ABW5PL27_9BACI|nr:FTR1 family protein [Terrilactibacillus laevilacticus]